MFSCCSSFHPNSSWFFSSTLRKTSQNWCTENKLSSRTVLSFLYFGFFFYPNLTQQLICSRIVCPKTNLSQKQVLLAKMFNRMWFLEIPETHKHLRQEFEGVLQCVYQAKMQKQSLNLVASSWSWLGYIFYRIFSVTWAQRWRSPDLHPLLEWKLENQHVFRRQRRRLLAEQFDKIWCFEGHLQLR